MTHFKSNFEFLSEYNIVFRDLGYSAEINFIPDPNMTLVKLRQLGEVLASEIAARVGIELDDEKRQVDLLRHIDYKMNLDSNIRSAFHNLRKIGNKAVHDFQSSTHRDALIGLNLAFMLSGWFYREFGGEKGRKFKLGKFIKPQDPSQNVRELEEKIRILESSNLKSTERIKLAESLKGIQNQKLEAERIRNEEMQAEREVWETLALETEQKLTQTINEFESRQLEKAQRFNQQPVKEQKQFLQLIEESRLDLSEADTRLIIDQQLINAGWETDTDNLRYSKGTKPEANRNKAIAEWPTSSGPADYVLFMGLIPVAVIEAKKKNKNVYGDIDQAKRYSKDFLTKDLCTIDNNYNEYQIPLVFSTNGRPYLKQLEQESGIWFLDVRDATNQRRVLHGWYSPEELKEYLKQDIHNAEEKLKEMDFNYDFTLRPYQIKAIQAVEESIQNGDQTALVAMATGTGKTKTSIALVYRLLKSERFRRILFLVDRSALGEQAADSFKETRMENLNTFADIFGLKELTDQSPDSDTKVQIATVQGMVKRIFYNNGEQSQPSVGQYDCIVVDECHRGYLLDREMGEAELEFRNQSDYISKYRSVIEYFDAYRIGLTATPALHTSQIFGNPVYTYTYTEAVVDGFLADHLPPIRIITKLAQDGIKYEVNEEVQIYDPQTNQIELFNTPDELDFDVSQFNRSVINKNFNLAVIKYLIEKDMIDPYQEAKTLVYCVTDKHADMVVELFHTVCEEYYGGIDDGAIQKITGKSDKPLEKIRYFKNDRLPNIAVTVDLLTTGIDVPKICNLVFLRRVNSRILFEQMLGRATRRCDEIGKETFRIFDAVDIYEKLEETSSMKPVATDPKITFTQLENELSNSEQQSLNKLARDQFLAKLQSKKRHLTDQQKDGFEMVAGQSPDAFIDDLKSMDLSTIAEWFTQHPGLGELLDSRYGDSKPRPVIISDHPDEVTDVAHGYGDGQKPEDYLKAFEKFVKANSNRMQALQVVVTRPWELTRKSLKELAVELDINAFRELDLKAAWFEATNQDIAARIIGFIRQAALGEPLESWEDRVSSALEVILATKQWTTPQKKWLQAIANQTIATTIVDHKALDQGLLKDQLGGKRRANKLFDNKIEDILLQFNKALWQ
ncbi:MAG: type I restriction-modification system endonuclease [Gammaproteobacteria bacterium]|nr:type I restriction-modification system endonuclease [Gammaproteobacteria bacterium]